jgi:hypothetical protein
MVDAAARLRVSRKEEEELCVMYPDYERGRESEEEMGQKNF